MQISGIFMKNNKKAKNRFCEFTILKNGEFFTCSGATLNILKGTPIVVTGEQDERHQDKITLSSVYIDSSNQNAMIKFLGDKNFKGVGKTAAKKIYNKLWEVAGLSGYDDICKLPAIDIEKALCDLKINESARLQIIPALLETTQRMDILEKILPYGGTYQQAGNLFEKYPGNAIESLYENPYIGINCGIPFYMCDNMAYSENIDVLDTKRISAIEIMICRIIERTGSCCERLNQVIDIAKNMQRKSNYETLPDALILSYLISSKKFKFLSSENRGILVYPKVLYNTEVAIVNELKRLMNSAENLGFTGYRGKSKLDEDQIAAVSLLENSGVYIVTGGPGAGKTTTIKEYIAEYTKLCPDNAIHLCAPTGRAAVRISESSNYELNATTIHKLLGVKAYGETQEFMFNHDMQLEKGMYIVDEMSMVDEKLFMRLLMAIPNGSLLILSGDPGQLPSVSAGTVLKDLIASKKIPCVKLTHIHRQSEGSSIIKNYYKISSGDTDLITDGSFNICEYSNNQDILNAAVGLYKKYNTEKSDDFQILSLTRKGSLGKYKIDEAIDDYRRSTRKEIYHSKYAPGDKIMMIMNNYNEGYWNGDVGTVTSAEQGCVKARFYDGMRTIESENYSDMELAFACTVHKAQGSEYKVVVLVVDDEYDIMLYNSIFLTAVTRAQMKLYILTKPGVIKKAITTFKDDERITGLTELMQILP